MFKKYNFTVDIILMFKADTNLKSVNTEQRDKFEMEHGSGPLHLEISLGYCV